MEDFLIAEAQRAEVITSKYDRVQKNPNRWSKHMAPWYDEDCKKTKLNYKIIKRRHGKRHTATKTAYQTFKDTCKKKRAQLQLQLPEILKYRPK